ncbi:unnamed protein product [Pleuronectes platessa]|uniref:Uncharacterized protein n=1 Tax=Pleuronectes platessa TaxID=8262 RepID=A0A9N7VMN4_PLEPL|nr:unnamed protein product [Pleuronectes platessa]
MLFLEKTLCTSGGTTLLTALGSTTARTQHSTSTSSSSSFPGGERRSTCRGRLSTAERRCVALWDLDRCHAVMEKESQSAPAVCKVFVPAIVSKRRPGPHALDLCPGEWQQGDTRLPHRQMLFPGCELSGRVTSVTTSSCSQRLRGKLVSGRGNPGNIWNRHRLNPDFRQGIISCFIKRIKLQSREFDQSPAHYTLSRGLFITSHHKDKEKPWRGGGVRIRPCGSVFVEFSCLSSHTVLDQVLCRTQPPRCLRSMEDEPSVCSALSDVESRRDKSFHRRPSLCHLKAVDIIDHTPPPDGSVVNVNPVAPEELMQSADWLSATLVLSMLPGRRFHRRKIFTIEAEPREETHDVTIRHREHLALPQFTSSSFPQAARGISGRSEQLHFSTMRGLHEQSSGPEGC